MGKSDDTRPSKPEKPSSPPQDQTNIPVYPDWAAMQAYYGPRVAVPPYFNSAVASGHAPHPYMWGPPPPMMPPYGAPYAAIYANGGVYAHPGVPLAGTPYVETPTKSSGHSDQGLMKKLKGFDGLAMSIGNGSADSAEGGANRTHSQSAETGSSSDRSNGKAAGAGQNGRKRSHDEIPLVGGVKTPVPAGENERELKRERRKQSNRDSARRSRLRKQAEAEELSVKVESLNTENMTLKSEINRLTENSEKLKLENAVLTDKLKNVQEGRTEMVISTNTVSEKRMPIGTENLLSRVHSGSVDRSDEGGETYENNSNSGAKLRQLLETSPRADAVAAG